MFQETTETFRKPQLVSPFLTYTDSLNLYLGYSYTRLISQPAKYQNYA